MAQPGEMKRLKGDGITLNAAVWEGAGPPVICLHGITANCRCWDEMAEALAVRHRLIALDLRGRGRSDKPASGYSMEHHVRDIACLMDDLGLEKAVLMGHSLGAFISVVFAALHPERTAGAILIDGGGNLRADQMDGILEAIQPAFERLGKVFPSAKAYLEAVKKTPYINPWSQTIESYYRYEIEPVAGGVRTNIDPAHIQEEAANVKKLEPALFYDRVQCPTLIIRALIGLNRPQDLLLPDPVLERMLNAIAQSRALDVPDLNHFGLVFQPHQGRDKAILEFLEE